MSVTIVNGLQNRVGLRRKDYTFASLHGGQAPKDKPPALSPEDIYAEPKSSDDESSTKHELADTGLSDGSLTGAAKKKKNKGTTRLDENGKSQGSSSPKEETAQWASASLQNLPSHFSNTAFTSKKPSATHLGSQSSQKRPRDEMDDDMGSFGSSQSKKAKMKTYGGLSNIHKGSAMEDKRPTKAAPAEKRKGGRDYRRPNAEAALARRKSISNLGL